MNVTEEPEEVFIYMTSGLHGVMVKAVLNRLRGSCTIYSADGKMLMKLEKLTPKRLCEIKQQINSYIAKQKNKLRGFSSRGYSW